MSVLNDLHLNRLLGQGILLTNYLQNITVKFAVARLVQCSGMAQCTDSCQLSGCTQEGLVSIFCLQWLYGKLLVMSLNIAIQPRIGRLHIINTL